MNLIFVPGSPCAIDAVELNEHGQCLGLHSGLSLHDLQTRHPSAQVGMLRADRGRTSPAVYR